MMNHNRFIPILALLCCVMAAFCLTPVKSQATGITPFINDSPIIWTLDPDPTSLNTAPHAAILAALGPANYAKLLKTWAACSNPGSPALYGVTVGIMYCVKSYISDSTHIYATGFSNDTPVLGIRINYFVRLYQACCMLGGLALFGLRFMTLQVAKPAKETFLFLMKGAFAIWVITQAPTLFDIFAAALGEGISWMNSLLPLIVPPASCTLIAPLKPLLVGVASLNPPPPPMPAFSYDEYEIWHFIDCIYLTFFGAAYPDTTGSSSFSLPNIGQNSLIYASAIPIIATALFTSTIGIAVFFLGIGAIISMLELFMKAMMIVLTAYLTMALFSLLAPFIAPLLFFETHREDAYGMKLFKNWASVLLGSVIQPIIVVAYLSFCGVLIMAFMMGDKSPDNDIRTIFANCGQPDTPGDGICSFHQLYPPFPDWYLPFTDIPNIGAVGNFNTMLELNPVIAHMSVLGDPQVTSVNCKIIDRAKNYVKQLANDQTNQIASKANGTSVNGANRLKTTNTRMDKLLLTFLAMIITAIILYQLMEVVPELAMSLGGAGVMNLWQSASVPFIGMIRKAAEGAESGAKGAGGKGLFAGVTNMKGAVTGAFQDLQKSITGKR